MNDQTKLPCVGDDVRRIMSPEAVAAVTSNQMTPAQPKESEIILQEKQGWDYGMSVAVEKAPAGASASIGRRDGFGSKSQSDPAWQLTTILMTQRMLDGPKPAVINRCDEDARRVAG